MKVIYNEFDLTAIGDVTLKWRREYEGGEAPQRCKVTVDATVKIFERSYSDNYARVKEAQQALLQPNQLLVWQNDETGETYINQTATLASNNFPEEWGQYFQQLDLTLIYYEAVDTSEQNLPCSFVKTGYKGAPFTFDNVTKWTESASTKRFSSFRAHREETRARLAVEGLILADTTLPLAQRQAALASKVAALRTQMNSASGTLTFGNAGATMFNGVVRVNSFEAEASHGINGVPFKFTADYTLFPNESNYATVEATAEQKDGMTGEIFLNLTGKVQATDEATTRTKLDAVVQAFLTQYGFANGQQLEYDTTPNLISANDDGDTFTELTFSIRWRNWKATNQKATFQQTGSQNDPVPLGNVRTWDDDYRAERFDVQRSERRHATGMISASGTFPVDPTMALSDRRTALLAQQRAMKAEINCADGTLVYGDWSQVVRVDDFAAKINQAETGIDWTLSASYSLFPNEGGYATCQFTADQRTDTETGDQFLTFSGEILAPNGSLARAKLNSLRTATLATYGFAANQLVRGGSQAHDVAANGDSTTGIPEGMETEDDVAGVSFIRLTFNEEYRHRAPGLVVSSKYQINSRDDTATGLMATTYSGSVTASGANVDVALAAAVARALVLGANKASTIDSTAFLKSQQMTLEKRQLTTDTPEEFVSLQFAFEYQSKMPAGRSYAEMNTATASDSFGPDSQTVNGFVVARDQATAQAIYQTQIRAAYSKSLIRNETTTSQQVLAESSQITSGLIYPVGTQNPQAPASMLTQWLRLEFNFTVHSAKPLGRAAARYSMNVNRDFLNLKITTQVRGSVWAADSGAADALVTALFGKMAAGQQTFSERGEDHDYTPELDAFIKLDFNDYYEDRVTGIAGILECRVTETVRYSSTRWAVQPVPYDFNLANGVSVVQPAGQAEGMRSVRGTVTAGTLATAQAWAWLQQELLTGDDTGFYPQPPEMENDFEFAPRVNGIVSGSGQNVRLFRVHFTFAEILPNYPAPS